MPTPDLTGASNAFERGPAGRCGHGQPFRRIADVRIAAARALAELRYPPAAATLATIIAGKRIRMADISEKVAIFEAYGTVAGEDGIRLLDSLLNKKGGLLGKKESTEIRAAAALGLGCVATPEARAVLERATQDEDPVVRSNVNRALRDEE